MRAIQGGAMPGCVLTVGKFESIHRGHRALIEDVIRRAKAAGLASAVMVFEPHPNKILGEPGYKPLFTADERAYLLAPDEPCNSPDYLYVCPFDAEFAALSPAAFCQKLFRELNAREIVVGEGYRFGHERGGTAEVLRQAASAYGAAVHVFPALPCEGTRNTLSTSHIRALLLAKRLPEAQHLLGFPFFVMGAVTQGRRLGRAMGFPTLNLYPPRGKFLPADGVYATQTHIQGRTFSGITNIGLRPTVAAIRAADAAPCGGRTRRSVETYIFDLPAELARGELYGLPIRTDLLRFIRPERRFETLEALKAQIHLDIRAGIP